MKSVFTFLALILLSNISFTQTSEEIMLEAYPDEPAVLELSGFDILWQNMIAAKKSGDETLHLKYSKQLKSEYPEKFVSSQRQVNFKSATQEEVDEFNADPSRVAEIMIYSGSLLTYGTDTHIGGNPRTIRLRSAPDGTQYLGFGPATNDTIYIFRSTDAGSTWNLFTFGATPGTTGKGFDFYITDTTGNYRLGLVISTAISGGDAFLTFITFSPDSPLALMINTFAVPDPGRGFIHPVIVSDGYYYSPATTYWYVSYQDYSSSTPTINPVRAALTTDWGETWTFTTVRSGFNDYDVAIEFNSYPGMDSVYVLLSNNLTLSNPNLRLRRVALSNWTGTFSQFNPATTSEPEFHGALKVNRLTGEMICAFTRRQSGVNNLAYVYSRPGAEYFTPTIPTFIGQNSHNEGGVDINCIEGGDVYRLAYLANGPSKDTVIFKWSFDLSMGFEGHMVVNENNNASGQIFPSVSGHWSPVLSGGNSEATGIAFGGSGQTGLFYHSISDDIIPVELTAFSAKAEGKNVHLIWQTASESNNMGFEIERKNINNYEVIGFVNGNGTTAEISNYSFADVDISPGLYTYRLKQIDFDGSFEYSNEVEVNVFAPGEFALSQNYPNPFNPVTIIRYSLPKDENIKLSIYNLLGEELNILVNEMQKEGSHQIEWRGVDKNNNILPTGVYFYRLKAGKFVDVKKMMFIK